MTIRHGEKYVVESLTQFKNRLNVNTTEMIHALPEGAKQDLVEQENTIREDIDGADPITTDEIGEVMVDTFNEFVIERGTNTIIQDVLEARDREYTHIYEAPIHRIIELHPKDNC